MSVNCDFGGVQWHSGRASVRGERVLNLPPPSCVLKQDTLIPESTGNTRPDMTEKLLTGTLSLNTNKNKNCDFYSTFSEPQNLKFISNVPSQNPNLHITK